MFGAVTVIGRVIAHRIKKKSARAGASLRVKTGRSAKKKGNVFFGLEARLRTNISG